MSLIVDMMRKVGRQNLGIESWKPRFTLKLTEMGNGINTSVLRPLTYFYIFKKSPVAFHNMHLGYDLVGNQQNLLKST